jgi:hypothetical protein
VPGTRCVAARSRFGHARALLSGASSRSTASSR